MGTEELLTTLTMMEVEGYIEQTEGDRYKRAQRFDTKKKILGELK